MLTIQGFGRHVMTRSSTIRGIQLSILFAVLFVPWVAGFTVSAQSEASPVFEANGDWKTDDGELQGKWSIGGKLDLAESGKFEGNLRLEDFAGLPPMVAVSGTFDRDQLQFSVEAPVEDSAEGAGPAAEDVAEGSTEASAGASDEPSASAPSNDLTFDRAVKSLTVETKIEGAKITGTFVSPEGVAGTWEGWWTLRQRSAALKAAQAVEEQ